MLKGVSFLFWVCDKTFIKRILIFILLIYNSFNTKIIT